MRKAHEVANKSFKKRKKISFFNVAIFGFLIYFVYTFFNQQIQINNYNSKIDVYKSDIENKNKLVSYYNEQKTNIETDQYIEDVARDTLGYVKPYEKIFVDANK